MAPGEEMFAYRLGLSCSCQQCRARGWRQGRRGSDRSDGVGRRRWGSALGHRPGITDRLPSALPLPVLNAFKYPLLIGVGLSTVVGLLSCLIGYCSSHWCCKKEVQETRRERRRLMSMEMD